MSATPSAPSPSWTSPEVAELDRDVLVHGGDRHVFRHGGRRRYRGAARHASPRPDRGRGDRGDIGASPAISTSSPADMICSRSTSARAAPSRIRTCSGAFLILPALFALQSVVSDRLGKSFRSSDRARHHGAGDPAGVFPRRLGRARDHLGLHAGADGPDQPVAGAALAHHRDVGGRRHRRRDAARRAAVVRFHPRDVQAARQLRPELRRGPLRPVRPAYPRRAHGARPAVRHRAAAVPQLFSRGHPQLLSERLHVGRLDFRDLLPRAGVRHGHHGISPRLRPRALAARLSRDLSRPSSARSARALSSTPTTGGTSG